MLNKVQIPVSLGLGIDTKKDEKQLQGSLLSLENAYIKKTGSLSKRFGYDLLPKDILPTGQITGAISLAKYEEELVLLSSGGIYSYAPENKKWGFRGVNLTSTVTLSNVVSNSYSQTNPDVAVASGVAVYAWEDSSGGVKASVVDFTSGVSLVPEIQLKANATRPRVVVCANTIYVFYQEGGSIYCRKVQGGVFSDEATVATDLEVDFGGDDSTHFAVTILSSKMLVTYRATGGKLKIIYFLVDLTIGGLPSGCPTPVAFDDIDPTTSLDIITYQNLIHIISSGSNTVYLCLNPNFTINIAAAEISAISLKSVGMVDTPDGIDVYGEVAVDDYNNYVQFTRISDGTVDPSLPAFDSNIIQRAAGLLTKPFYSNGYSYIVVSFHSKNRLQDTNFCINNNGDLLARILPTTAGGHNTVGSCLAGVWFSGLKHHTVFAKKSRIGGSGVVSTSTVGAGIDITSAYSATSQLGKNLHIAGGYVKTYDGFSLVEHNFHLYPDEPDVTVITSGTASPTNGSDGDFYIETDVKKLYQKISGSWTEVGAGDFLSAGSYQYVIVYEWIDFAGQMHRSETSIAVTVSIAAGAGSIVTIPTLRFTDKKGVRTPPIISIYRTIADGTIFYKASDDDDPLYNDVTADAVTFIDVVSDATLQTRQMLYTTGGVLDNTQAPACTYLKTYKNRLFAIGLENSTEIAYSKEFVSSEGVAFSDLLRKQVDTKGGRLTAIAELDDKLVLFKRSNLFILTGQGPTDTATQDDFYIQSLTADIGCSDQKSIVETPLGVMFKSDKGIWLLDRGLNTKYIGDRVEDFNHLTIASATLVADVNQVRFTTEEGTTLVYDYFYDTWSTFTNHQAVSAINWQSSFVYAKTNGDVLVENTTTYSDAGTPIKMRIETGWFSMSGLQGYGRLYGIQLLGTYKSPHLLRISLSYDFNNSVKDVHTVAVMERSLFNEDLIGVIFGGIDSENYQFEIKPRIQKCESWKLIIEDISPDSTPQASLDLSAITIEYGVKKGYNKITGSRRM